jgi:hypothetical protein
MPAALESLSEQAQRDLWAGVLLAENHAKQNEAAPARLAVLKAAKLSRSGPAFRRFRPLAVQYDVPLKPTMKSPPLAFLDVGQNPQKYLAVRLELPGKLWVGEPLELRAVLTNIGDRQIALGKDGLMEPAMAVVVTAGQGDQQKQFTNLPMIHWPAPRYLQPGKSLASSVRLDVGELRQHLMNRALEDVELQISVVVDPQPTAQGVRSALPTLSVEPQRVIRSDVLSQYEPAWRDNPGRSYQRAMGFIVRDFQMGGLETRCAAACKVAALLGTLREAQANRQPIPEPLADVVKKPVLLSMTKALLEDRSPVVRAAMLASLQVVRVDGDILALLGPMVADESALVRFRAVELIGSTAGRDARHMLAALAKDGDPLVAMAAEFFIRPPR